MRYGVAQTPELPRWPEIVFSGHCYAYRESHPGTNSLYLSMYLKTYRLACYDLPHSRPVQGDLETLLGTFLTTVKEAGGQAVSSWRIVGRFGCHQREIDTSTTSVLRYFSMTEREPDRCRSFKVAKKVVYYPFM
jgi:hypothetical protein